MQIITAVNRHDPPDYPRIPRWMNIKKVCDGLRNAFFVMFSQANKDKTLESLTDNVE